MQATHGFTWPICATTNLRLCKTNAHDGNWTPENETASDLCQAAVVLVAGWHLPSDAKRVATRVHSGLVQGICARGMQRDQGVARFMVCCAQNCLLQACTTVDSC